MPETIFSKIIAREVPADIIHEDERCLAFRDVSPQAPLHVLIIPKQPMTNLAEAGEADRDLLGHLLLTAARIAADQGHGEGFRVVINNGTEGGQTVFHLHLHLLAGRTMHWPPG